VTDFVNDGMAAMHGAMMKEIGGAMPHGTRGAMRDGLPNAATVPSGR
jgi:hypothetical protein